MKQEVSLFSTSLKDFFTPKMLKFTLIPFFATFILMYIVFFIFAGIGVDYLGTLEIQTSQTSIQNGVPHTQTLSASLEGSSILTFLMNYTLTSWIASFFIYAIGGILTLYLSIFLALLFIGFLTPYILLEIQERHYPNIAMQGDFPIFTTLLLTLRWTFVMLALFVLFIPLYFIPFLNILALNFPLYYFFHKMLLYDVASSISSKEEFKQIKYYNASNFRVKTLLLFLISLIPFAVLFATVFYVIYLGHAYFEEVKKIRNIP